MGKNGGWKFYNIAKLAGWGLLGGAGAALLGRFLAGRTASYMASLFMTEPYEKNLWEVFSAGGRTGAHVIVETNLRAQEGKPVKRPIGGPRSRSLPGFDRLMFNVAQLATLPAPGNMPVDTSLIIGKKAARPMKLETPILISAMAYGTALSEKAKVALAKGATMAGTATNTGEGAFLPAERKAAKNLIIQYHRGSWTKEPEVLKQADMLEIQLGQGARAGIGHLIKPEEMDNTLRKALGIKPGQSAVTQARLPDISLPEGLKHLVSGLRQLTGGVPIGVKLVTGNDLEKDLQAVIDAGVDAITLDGAQGATVKSYPILQDDFGLPTLYGLCRATRFLEKTGKRGQISLLVSGGLFTPGDYLKAMALGADGVAIGSMALFAVTHTQVFEALPFEPPLEVVYYNGKYSNKFDVEKGARYLSNYLAACVEEMKEATRALGKTALRDVSREDLFALDDITAAVTGVSPGYKPWGHDT